MRSLRHREGLNPMTSIFIGGRWGHTERKTPCKDTFNGSSNPMSGIFTREKLGHTEKGKPCKDTVTGPSGKKGTFGLGMKG